MRIRLDFHWKNFIWFAIIFGLAMVMYFTIGFAWWVLPVYGLAYLAIRNTKFELSEKLPWLWTAILFVGGAALNTFSVQYLLLDAELFARTTALKLFLNVLVCLVLYLLMLLFSNRVTLSCIAANVFWLIFGFVNYFVYLFRQNEFYFADIRSIGTGLSVAGQYQLRLNDKGCYVIFACALYITLVRRMNVEFGKRWQMSIISLLAVVLCCVAVGVETMEVNTETWEQKGTYRNGYFLNFVLSVRDSFVGKPEGYSKEAVEALEEEYGSREDASPGEKDTSLDEKDTSPGEKDTSLNEKDTSPNEKSPTIIVIMNESFADLSVIGPMETNSPVTPFIDSLSENTVKGYALSSVFGAKTPNSEWEFLSGGTMAFLPGGSVVYQQYISETPTTLVSTLKNEGYTCVAMHPYYDTGWSRNLVYPDIGFDEMYFIEDFDKTQVYREYITDQEMYRKVIDRFENRKRNEKLFIMGITMQNHGGYTTEYDNFPEPIYKIGRSYTDANQYLSLINASDKAVEELIQYFSQVEEPVEIVFFGDHQPSLTTEFYPILNGKGTTNLSEEEMENLYKVPFFIWTNYDSPEETVEITSLNYLSTMTLERAGIDLPPYNQFLADLREQIPAINARGYYSLNNETYLAVEDASGREAEWLRRYEILQYNAMFDEKDRSNLFFPYIEE